MQYTNEQRNCITYSQHLIMRFIHAVSSRIIPSLLTSTHLQDVSSLLLHPFCTTALGTLPIMHHSSGAQFTQLARLAAINHPMKNVWGKNKSRKLPRAGMEKGQVRHRISFGMQHTLFLPQQKDNRAKNSKAAFHPSPYAARRGSAEFMIESCLLCYKCTACVRLRKRK